MSSTSPVPADCPAGPRHRDRTSVVAAAARIRTAEHRPYRLPGESAQAYDDPQVSGYQAEFGRKPWRARVPFGGFRLVVRRGAADRGHHPGAQQALPIAHGHTGRLRRPAAPVERGEQELPAAVAGEDPAGAVPAVRCSREPHDQQRGAGPTPNRKGGPSRARPGTNGGARRPPPRARPPGAGRHGRPTAARRSSCSVPAPAARPATSAALPATGVPGPGGVIGPAARRDEGTCSHGARRRLSRAGRQLATRPYRPGCRARSPGPRRSRTVA